MRDGEGEGNGDRRIDRVAAFFEDGQADLRRLRRCGGKCRVLRDSLRTGEERCRDEE